MSMPESVRMPTVILAEIKEVLSNVDTQFRATGQPSARVQRALNALSGLTTDMPRQGLPFGIIDPDYARIYTIARTLAWAEGYALTLHGSFTRDLDLLAAPWAERCCEPEHLVRRIAEAAELRISDSDPSQKPHGRQVWTLRLPGFGEPRWVDFGVISPFVGGDAERG